MEVAGAKPPGWARAWRSRDNWVLPQREKVGGTEQRDASRCIFIAEALKKRTGGVEEENGSGVAFCVAGTKAGVWPPTGKKTPGLLLRRSGEELAGLGNETWGCSVTGKALSEGKEGARMCCDGMCM